MNSRLLAAAFLVTCAATATALPPTIPQIPDDFVTEHDAGALAAEVRAGEGTLARFARLFRTTREPVRQLLLRRLRHAARSSEDPSHQEAAAWLLEVLEKVPTLLVRYLRVRSVDDAAYARALRASKVQEHYRDRRGFLRRRTHLLLSGTSQELDAFVADQGLEVETQEDVEALEVHLKYMNSDDPGNMVRERRMEYRYTVRPGIHEGLTWIDWLERRPASAVCRGVKDGQLEMAYRSGRGSIGKVEYDIRLPHDPEPFAEGSEGAYYGCNF